MSFLCLFTRKAACPSRVASLRIIRHIKSHSGTDMSSENVAQLRNPYRGKHDTFLEHQLVSKNPIRQFEDWFNIAANHENIIEANAMTLATVNADGKPSARIVLLKGFGEDGFRFFTNYSSRKGQELDVNPNVALVLYWEPLHRSIRIEGVAEKLNDEESAKYFASRPRGSQIAAHASTKQSSPIESRDKLSEIEKSIEEKYEGVDVPKPEFWGGYVVMPSVIEFWQGQSNRMHDRLRFRRKKSDDSFTGNPCLREGENGWVFERLMP